MLFWQYCYSLVLIYIRINAEVTNIELTGFPVFFWHDNSAFMVALYMKLIEDIAVYF